MSEDKINPLTLLFTSNSAQTKVPLKAFSKDLKATAASNSSSDEDDMLSYKKQPNHDNNIDYNTSSRKKENPRKKSGNTYDFKTKWKTEICHFWEMNGFCQFGENVRLISFKPFFSALLPMDMMI